ncbi:MAG: hypothetical protein M3R24_26685 [Chloroflexota bacterium]|nr:hypothetical protein [Chloroflexota bacterium]
MSGTFDPRITAYFGDAVLRAGFMPLPHLFLRHYQALGLGHGEAMFVLQLMEINWDLAAPPKTVNDLANRMGVNARTIRRYSEAVAELGLITLYDQYDASGAQIENGYDLSPLFDRLAAFTPEPPPGGQARRREVRTPSSGHGVPERGSLSQTAPRSTACGPDKNDTPPPDKYDRPPTGRNVRPGADKLIKGRRIDGSGLKTETRILQEQNIMMHDTSAAGSAGKDRQPIAATPGQSLRHGQRLTPADVEQTDDILQRIGIDFPVRSRIRTSLAPGEAWTLWTYALAKRWSVPLLINEVYDKTSRQARPASLPHHYDPVGAALAQLPPATAEELLHLVADQCPSGLPDAFTQLVAATPQDNLVEVLQMVWDMIAELRKASGKPCPLLRSTANPPAAPQLHQMTWTAVLERLAAQVPQHEFATWLKETELLELDSACAFVGARNIFARDRIQADYLDPIRHILSDVLGCSVHVQVVLAASGA